MSNLLKNPKKIIKKQRKGSFLFIFFAFLMLILTIISAYLDFTLVEVEKIRMLQSFKATKWQI